MQEVGFAKGLFFGQYLGNKLLPYPDLDQRSARRPAGRRAAPAFASEQIDPAAIDRDAEIPQQRDRRPGQARRAGRLLAPGIRRRRLQPDLVLPDDRSARRPLRQHGAVRQRPSFDRPAGARAVRHAASSRPTSLPKLATGEWISAFALTEPEAGSDAANVQTTATPTPDGKGYVLNGQKRWITNGGIAQVLTVMARTPVPGSNETKITAFLVTPDMPGFEVVEKRMPKCGVRGTATARLAFNDMFVPKENILGQLGKGLRVALTVLDFGRTTFGASCTGAAKFCVAQATKHAQTRVQFGQPLANFELVKEKLAYMQAGAFAMEAATYQTAALIDSGEGDYMLETAMLKVFSTDVLWRIVNDTIQIFGGKAYFTDEPYERMMRDARINMIGEGANDVLRAFTALVGMRDVGLELKGVLDAAKSPLSNLGKLGGFAGRKLESFFSSPAVDVQHSRAGVRRHCAWASWSATFGSQVEAVLRNYQESILDRQYPAGPHRRQRQRAVRQRLRAAAARPDAGPRPAGRGPQAGAANRPLLSARPPRAASTTTSTTCGSTTTKRPCSLADSLLAKYRA